MTTRESRNWHSEHVDGGIAIGEDCSSFARRVILINPTEKRGYDNWGGRGRSTQCYVLWFGAYGCKRLMIYAPHLEDALDEAIDWLAEYAPGLLCDDAVEEEYRRLISDPEWLDGRDPSDDETIQAAQEEAEIDTTSGGNAGNRINSWEWGIALENPTTAELYAYIKGE